ncbi:glycoside hydrolase family 97 protein, partial [bacterium]|nr:glycoside hydrolase family 97 protein [bacterium]
MNNFSVLALLVFMLGATLQARPVVVKSPDGRIETTINTDKQLTWSVVSQGVTVLEASPLSMTFDNGVVAGKNMQGVKSRIRSVNQVLTPVVAVKNDRILDHYNEAEISSRDGYSVVFRCYNDGVAYRFITRFAKPVRVMDEEVRLVFSGDHATWFPEEESMFSHNERVYLDVKLSDISNDRMCSLPMMVRIADGPKVLISEADLEDYPGLWLRGGSTAHTLQGLLSQAALETRLSGDRDVRILRHANYLAETKGTRSFPWRYLIIAHADKQLIESEMTFKLASPCALKETSWIKPGKVAWDWWNALNLYGVDFKAGVNTATYKHYIDFAAKYGIPYIILDEGWYDLKDLMKVVPEVDMEELVRYSREKNVGLVLWTTWKALDDKMEEAMTQFEKWGIRGIKVDFMKSDDQWMVNFYYRT